MNSKNGLNEPKQNAGQKENPGALKSVVLGKLGKAHGIKGWVRVISFTSPEANILEYRSFDAKGSGKQMALEIDEYKQQSGGFIAHIKGFDTPEAVRTLTGYELSVSVTELPELDQDDVYWYQLEGLMVENQHRQILGRIDRLLETGANDVLVVQASEQSIDERERLIPFIRGSIISDIDLIIGVVRVNWEADYLE